MEVVVAVRLEADKPQEVSGLSNPHDNLPCIMCRGRGAVTAKGI